MQVFAYYENKSFFLPHIDYLDMQSGNWLEQLMQMITNCNVFVPILSNDYLEGPISKPELDLALRNYYADNKTSIVPILIEGTPDKYKKHFIGGIHMVQAQEGLDEEKIKEIAYLALGISRNPFK